jgi:hypothetical protein
MCDVIDDLINQVHDGNYDRLEQGLEVIREMGIRMERKLREYKQREEEL